MKIIYIAHPVALPDKAENLKQIQHIVRDLNMAHRDLVPFAPYMTDCLTLDDTDFKQRNRGIANNIALFEKGIIDEVWLFGNRISEGMWQEIDLANRLQIPIEARTEGTKNALIAKSLRDKRQSLS